jgi:hypothetical protein
LLTPPSSNPKQHQNLSTRETTLAHHVFGGYMRQTTTCGGCGAASVRYFAGREVQLDIPPGVGDVEGALALLTQGAFWRGWSRER